MAGPTRNGKTQLFDQRTNDGGFPDMEERGLAPTGPPSASTVAETLAKKPDALRDIISGAAFRDAVARVLPKHLTPERFVGVAIAALTRTPKLQRCTPVSVLKCLMELSMYGLEADGRRAHLIPFDNAVKDGDGRKTGEKRMECSLIVDYKGIVECVRRSGEVSYIHADVVYPEDSFRFKYGSGAELVHEPAEAGEQDTKAIRCAYSYVRLRDGSEDFVVLSKREVDGIRRRSRAANDGPWVTDYAEMAKKTAFRRHSKWLPFSPEVRQVVEHGDDVNDAPTRPAFGGEVFDLPAEAAAEAEPEKGEAPAEEVPA